MAEQAASIATHTEQQAIRITVDLHEGVMSMDPLELMTVLW